MPGYFNQGPGGNRYGGPQYRQAPMGGGSSGFRGGSRGGYGSNNFRGGYDNYGYYAPSSGMMLPQQNEMNFSRPSVKSRLVDNRHMGSYNDRSMNQGQSQPRKRPRDFYEYYDKLGAWQPLVPSPNFDGSIKKRLKFSQKKKEEETKKEDKEGEETEVKEEEENAETKADDTATADTEVKSEEAEAAAVDNGEEVKEEKETTDEEKTEDKDAKEKTPEKNAASDLDVRALKCHICSIDEFNSKDEFNDHLESVGHFDMTHAYHTRNGAVLQLLRSNAQLAAMKQIAESRTSITGKIKTKECFKCHCYVMGKIEDHLKTAEHLMVVNFLRNKCCGRWFNNPAIFEQHKLTIPHLKKQFASLNSLKENDQLDQEAGIDESTIEAPVKEEKTETEEESKENGEEKKEEEKIEPLILPVYNPDEIFAPEYLNKIARYQCKACWSLLFMNDEIKANHCKSHMHYNAVVERLKKEHERKVKAEEKRKKAEEAAKAKTEEAAEANEENAGSDVTLEDLTVENVIDEDETENADESVDKTDETENKEEKEPEPEPEEQTAKPKRGRGRGKGRGKR